MGRVITAAGVAVLAVVLLIGGISTAEQTLNAATIVTVGHLEIHLTYPTGPNTSTDPAAFLTARSAPT